MKKAISVFLSVIILILSINSSFIVFALNENTNIDAIVEELQEIYDEQEDNGIDFETSTKCRVLLKSLKRPSSYQGGEILKIGDNNYAIQYNDVSTCNMALSYYKGLSYVEWAEKDQVLELQENDITSYGGDMMGTYSSKEYLKANNINFENKIKVAVIDDGFLDGYEIRYDFDGRLIDTHFNSSSQKTDNDTVVCHCRHGNNIAAIIYDNTCSNVEIWGYKAANENLAGTQLSYTLAIEKAIEDNVNVINLSVGNGEGSPEQFSMMRDSILKAIQNNIVVVVASGNINTNAENTFPASMEEVFTVGAIDYNGNRTYFSNWGECVDFVAPGYQVEIDNDYDSITGKIKKAVNGTSFSAPYITAASAMVLSVNPTLSIEEIQEALIASCITPDELKYSSPYLHKLMCFDNEDKQNDRDLNNYALYLYDADDEALYYGYGFPQVQKIVGETNICNKPSLSHQSGTYNDKFNLTITADKGDRIYYTLDGKFPTEKNGILYAEPITISQTTSIRAAAFSKDKVKSLPINADYKIEYLAPESDFTIDDRGYITSYLGKTREIRVPDIINGKIVKGVAKRAFYNQKGNLLGVHLPDTVTEIEDSAFFNATLKYFTAKGLKRVGDSALDAPLIYLNSPNIEYVGICGLSQSELEKIEFEYLTETGDEPFDENPYLYEVNLPKLKIVAEMAFDGDRRLAHVNLPEATVIGDCAFHNCYLLQDVRIPNVEHFEGEANFAKCHVLKEIHAPKLTGDLPKYCFQDNYKLTDFYAPKLESIGYESFVICKQLENLSIDNVISIDYGAFFGSGIKELHCPNLEVLGSYVFAGTDSDYISGLGYTINKNNLKTNITLKSIDAQKIEQVSDYAFAYTGRLQKLELPHCKTIGGNAFYKSKINYLYAPNLETAKSMPTVDNSTIILSSAFEKCTEDTKDRNYTVYGITSSYTDKWAAENNHKFIGTPAITKDVATEYNGADSLSIEAIGIDLTYEWYGSMNADGSEAVMINSETEGSFNPKDYKYYPYYFCRCTMHDNGKPFSVDSVICKNADYKEADYTAYNEAVAKANEILANRDNYKDVSELESLISEDVSGLSCLEQSAVDDITEKILNAISATVLKDADYSKYDAAVEKAKALDRNEYKDFSAVDEALSKDVSGKNVTEQDEVDKQTESILKAIEALEKKDIIYEIVQGANSTFDISKDTEIVIASNADFEKFVAVIVDGAELDKDCYSVNSGSTVVTLTAEYLRTLDLTEHNIVIKSMDGSASTVFTVFKSSSDESTTKPDETTKPSTTKPSESATESNTKSQNETTVKKDNNFISPKTGNDYSDKMLYVVALNSIVMGLLLLVKRRKQDVN